jgi:adenylate cyclase
MGFEIERKFLVTGEAYKTGSRRLKIVQGFLNDDLERSVRIRIISDDAYITIKGTSDGPVRREFEYPMPKADAEVMIREMCIPPPLLKDRYVLECHGLTWEVDEFSGENQGLVIAEVELPDEGFKLVLPDWIGKEVTGDKRYYNAYLARNPYRSWQ